MEEAGAAIHDRRACQVRAPGLVGINGGRYRLNAELAELAERPKSACPACSAFIVLRFYETHRCTDSLGSARARGRDRRVWLPGRGDPARVRRHAGLSDSPYSRAS